jgi:hypothetical protein
VEPNVWTERMLTALEKGVKGGIPCWAGVVFSSNGLCYSSSIL